MPTGPHHVALNATFLDPGRSGGPETYLRGLVPAVAAARPGLRLTVLTTRRGARALAEDGWTTFASLVGLPTDEGQRARRLVAEQLLVPASAARRGADLLHSLASTGPVRASLPTVVTLHDVTFLHMRTFGPATTAAMAATMFGAAHAAAGLLAGSAAAKADICATLRLDPERVAVVPHGAGREPLPSAVDPAEVRRRHGIDERARVVLCVSAVRPHKNQALLAEALPHLPDDVVVVVSGAHEAYVERVRQVARRHGVEDRLRLLGYVPDEELEGLWRTASAVAFPTLAEGSGLPAVEALRRGLPLACSDLPVLREAGGDLPRYFDPRDAADAARAITAVLDAPPEPAASQAWAAQFTWDSAAEGTLEVYERAMARAQG